MLAAIPQLAVHIGSQRCHHYTLRQIEALRYLFLKEMHWANGKSQAALWAEPVCTGSRLVDSAAEADQQAADGAEQQQKQQQKQQTEPLRKLVADHHSSAQQAVFAMTLTCNVLPRRKLSS